MRNYYINKVYDQLRKHDTLEHDGRPGEGALLITMIKGVLDRLRDHKNLVKDHWDSHTERELEELMGQEMDEVADALTDWPWGHNRGHLLHELRDLLTTTAFFLKNQEETVKCSEEN